MEKTKGKIMFVDDSENLRYVIKDYLELNGYEVVDFNNTDAAARSYNTNLYDLCIIDIMTAGRDGFTLLQEIRRIDEDVPVIILTARASKEERIKGFKLGCDDYIAKPFSIEELELRIQAILKRCRKARPVTDVIFQERIYKMGNFTFNYSGMQLIHPTVTRTLTRKEAELLKLLLDHKNKLIPREIILKEVWGDEDQTVGRSMDVFLTKLRSYLQVDDIGHIMPKVKGKRKVVYEEGYQPLVEICNAHGTGFILKVRE
jgi:DNA-binding response OmpR family regulator